MRVAKRLLQVINYFFSALLSDGKQKKIDRFVAS